MTLTGTMVLLVAGGLVAIGCSSDGAPAACETARRAAPTAATRRRRHPADGGPPATCGNVQPCGGDVAGNWMFVEECESVASFAAAAANFSTMAA